MNTEQLAEQLQNIIASGTEEEARNFIAEHFMEFPEEVREQLAVEMLSDAVGQELAELEALSKLKEDSAEMIGFLDEKVE